MDFLWEEGASFGHSWAASASNGIRFERLVVLKLENFNFLNFLNLASESPRMANKQLRNVGAMSH